MQRFTQQSVSRQRGAVLVEMALVTPIMLILMVAVADLTRAFVDHNTLTKAVRNGVRYVAANAYQGTTGVVSLNATLVSEARNLVVFGATSPPGGTPAVLAGLTLADITVTQIAGTNDIQITATHTIGGILGPALPFLPVFYGGPGTSMVHTLQATVAMKAL